MEQNPWINAYEAALCGLADVFFDGREAGENHGSSLGLDDNGEFNLSAIHGGEEVDQGLDGLNAGVLPTAVSELPDEAPGNPGLLGDGIEAGSSSLFQSPLQVVGDGFCRHGFIPLSV